MLRGSLAMDHMKTESDDVEETFSRSGTDQELESTLVGMGEARQENQRLKSLISEIMKDYQNLQKHVRDVFRREETSRNPANPTPLSGVDPVNSRESEELAVSLTLGRTPSGTTKDDDGRNIDLNDAGTEGEMMHEEFKLGLGFTHPERGSGEQPAKKRASCGSIGELKEDEIAEIWPPSKILKTMKGADDESSQPAQAKRARVSVRVRCDTPTVSIHRSAIK
ncbi:hypothetical protein SAY87_028886 [Trapa incisa]|uniref:Uncharacterized protein n=1 Tax=Trapa incisa TaxID=236973 RepID=A0AAN7QPR4_9MYRT|nr:hypothetical protein SAY87_028886 [Trapa incisa]